MKSDRRRLIVAGGAAAAAWLVNACATNHASPPASSRQPAATPEVAGASSKLSAAPSVVLPAGEDVAHYEQERPLSCEAAALHTALAVIGIAISEATILAAEPDSEDPDQGFRGNVDANQDLDDYGIHAKGLLKTLDILKTKGAVPQTAQGQLLHSLDEVRAALARRQPVVAWIPLELMPAERHAVTLDSGKVVHLVDHEHTVTLHGYDDNKLLALDPFDGTTPTYDAAAFGQGMSLFDDPALAIGK